MSENTQAILLLTAPLLAGKAASSPDLLSQSEYNRLARHLREIERQPADLLAAAAANLISACDHVIESARLQRLLGRGFLLSQAVESWRARSIWVASRADPHYPRRLKSRLREDAPVVVYGCGDIGLLERGGLAVVGSRNVDDALIDYTRGVGQLAAQARTTIISGGAKGVDRAAVSGALEAGGDASCVLAESLEGAAMNRDTRNQLMHGCLLLISRYDPKAGFSVGNAMQRNKLIYALADAALVVSSDLNKGGTWAGATEQLDKLKLVPIFVRSTGSASTGLDALRAKGAIPWPNPQDVNAFKGIFGIAQAASPRVRQADLSFPTISPASDLSVPGSTSSNVDHESARELVTHKSDGPTSTGMQVVASRADESAAIADHQFTTTSREGEDVADSSASPAAALFRTARDLVEGLLTVPMKDTDIALALDVSVNQARAWLQRLVKEGVLQVTRKPVRYLLSKQASILNDERSSQRLARTAGRRR